VKESAFVGFLCVMAPEAKLANLVSGEVRTDRKTGGVVFTVGVVAMRGQDSSVIQVSVVGEPVCVGVGTPLRVVDLEAVPWEHDGRSGIAWRAASVTPLGGAVAPGVAGAVPAVVAVAGGKGGDV
jgi:hypothetical protein